MMTAPSLPIQMIVGLGNPGAQYINTRHNAGFWAINEIAKLLNNKWKYEAKFHGEFCCSNTAYGKLYLLKPATFMNKSGVSVAALSQFYKIPSESILVIHDELDLAAGVVRLKWSGGHAGHNGLKDIARALGHLNVWRLRLGINHPGDRNAVADYVLSIPKIEDKIDIDNAIARCIKQLNLLSIGHFEKVMHTLHSG